MVMGPKLSRPNGYGNPVYRGYPAAIGGGPPSPKVVTECWKIQKNVSKISIFRSNFQLFTNIFESHELHRTDGCSASAKPEGAEGREASRTCRGVEPGALSRHYPEAGPLVCEARWGR
jgi:hypothetical protein